MSDYVGIDVHRKRSQVAVVTGDGTVEFNKNVMNGSEPFLRLIGDLPSGTLVAFEAAFGWGWLAGLLEDYGFDPHLDLPPASREIVTDCLAVIDGLAPVIGRARRRVAPVRQGRPAGQGADDAARHRPVHRPGHAGRDRGYYPVPQRRQAGQLGPADPGPPRLGPEGIRRASPCSLLLLRKILAATCCGRTRRERWPLQHGLRRLSRYDRGDHGIWDEEET